MWFHHKNEYNENVVNTNNIDTIKLHADEIRFFRGDEWTTFEYQNDEQAKLAFSQILQCFCENLSRV